MQGGLLAVVIDFKRQDAFVIASQAYVDSNLRPLYAGQLPPSVPLRLTKPDGSVVFVGCLVQRPHNHPQRQLFVPHNLASDLGLGEGDQIVCKPLICIPRAAKVFVSPLTIDDSEVVEMNALRIESELLRNVQVVFPRMIIRVAVFAGAYARLAVERIDDEAEREVVEGCAAMFEGTHFVVSIRARHAPGSGAGETESTSKPQWTFLRCLPVSGKMGEESSGSAGDSPSAAQPTGDTLTVHPNTAKRLGWQEDLKGGFRALDLRWVATLAEPKITPSFLRARLLPVKVLVREATPINEANTAMAAALASFVDQPTNVLVLPTDKAEEAVATKEDAKETPALAPDLHRRAAAPELNLEQLTAVHGDVPRELLEYLRFTFSHFGSRPSEGAGGNVLLCGGKGYGKSTIVSCVLGELTGIHTATLECTSDKQFLSDLRTVFVECVMCAPSVLVLDGFDTIAPAQKEGNVQAMTATTRATLEAFLTTSASLLSTAMHNRVAVVATSASRESLNECFRSARCFPKILTVSALTAKTRRALLAQIIPAAGDEAIGKVAALMDNYTPFDVKQASARIANKVSFNKVSGVSLAEHAEQALSTFTPLAHTGIKFLKGEKLSWSSVGGLSEAKKLLYDTLVLPMKHPSLFARLPLKTRSGILLYGPSGCGKTFIVEALVNAEGLNCIVVNGPEVFGKYIGQSEQKIRDVFERAQAAAPCVVFFDEFDSIAPQRGLDNSGVTDRVVNQLLCYLDGVEGRKDVYVVAASSRPDLIDAALLRPGRLDKAVLCPIPTHKDRLEIMRSLFLKLSISFDDDTLEQLATLTANWTPADLSTMVSTTNSLVCQRIIDSLITGGGGATPVVEEGDFLVAHLGEGASRDKVAEAIRLATRVPKSLFTHQRVEQALSVEDAFKAIALTRPSLTEKDIRNQKRIHELFSKTGSIAPPNPGMKLTQY